MCHRSLTTPLRPNRIPWRIEWGQHASRVLPMTGIAPLSEKADNNCQPTIQRAYHSRRHPSLLEVRVMDNK